MLKNCSFKKNATTEKTQDDYKCSYVPLMKKSEKYNKSPEFFLVCFTM